MPDISKEKLHKLRKNLKNYNVNGFIFTTTDEYINEYVPDYARRVEFLTNFRGSLAVVIVLEDKAAIFIDGRYTLQAKAEVDAKDYDILPYTLNSIKDWLHKNINSNTNIAINIRVTSLQELDIYEKIFNEINIKYSHITQHPVDDIWKEQPGLPSNLVVDYPIAFSGVDYKDKLALVAKYLNENNHDYMLITALDSIAWLLNIRGSDVFGSPLVLSQCLVSASGSCILFLSGNSIDDSVRKKDITILSSDQLDNQLNLIDSKNKFIIASYAPAYFAFLLKQKGFAVKVEEDFCYLQKAIKNKVEISSSAKAHIKDGVAITKLLYHLDSNINNITYNEVSLDNKLEYFRKEVSQNIFKDNSYIGCSFNSIVGADSNGAIVHYHAQEGSARQITANSYLLLDCGAQYIDGTTDITRTISFNKQDEKFKQHFTLVLKGHIALAKAKIKKGTRGYNLDILARQFLWQECLDYLHGTGHGIGCFLNVHEGPIGISAINDTVLEEGMIFSNEPGYYLEGHYGIRLENLYVVVADQNHHQNFMQLESLSMVPFDMKNVLISLLTAEEIQWLTKYHETVYKNLQQYLSSDEKIWFENYTKLS